MINILTLGHVKLEYQRVCRWSQVRENTVSTRLIDPAILLQVGELSQELKELPMRALLAAAFITYMSAAPEVSKV